MPTSGDEMEVVGSRRDTRRVVVGASLGTLFEWYDFNLFVLLAVPIGLNYFTGFPDTTRAIFALLLFAVGFVVRPLGALIFGRLSDMLGRRVTFLITVVMMGVATVLVGMLPSFNEIGIAAPILLLILRMLQGLAVGGEYAGAAVYLGEHVPEDRRAFYTSFIQATITCATLLALLLILAIRSSMPEADFAAWGWRIPFLLGIVPLVFSIWLRLRLEESPVFVAMRAQSQLSKAPLSEAVTQPATLRMMLVVLFGLVAGQAVLAYGGQVYPFVFMQSVLKIDFLTATVLQSCALAVALLGFVVFGWLADRIGRKTVIIVGFALGILTYFPLFMALTATANPALDAARRANQIVVEAPAGTCSFQFNPTGAARFSAACDTARSILASRGASYQVVDISADRPVAVIISSVRLPWGGEKFAEELGAGLTKAGFPLPGDPTTVHATHIFDIFTQQKLTVFAILCVLALYGSMVYAPLAAILVELFPARVRTTAISLPYNIGNGWIGGLLPATSFALVVQSGDLYSGLWYPVGFTILSLIVCWFFVPETRPVKAGIVRPVAG